MKEDSKIRANLPVHEPDGTHRSLVPSSIRIDGLALARPHREARHVQASAGNFSISIPLDRAANALLAMSLNGTNLSVEHGAPVRLVLPGGECFTSIKWLDHLEVRSDPGENTAETIALARLSSR